MDETKTQALPEEVEERVNIAYKLLLDGWTQAAIVRHLYNKDYGVSMRQCRNYVYQAQKALADESRHINRRAELALALQRYTRLYRLAMAADPPDRKEAASMEDRIVSLLNLSADSALKIDWEDEAKEMGVEDPAALFERMLQEFGGSDVKLK